MGFAGICNMPYIADGRFCVDWQETHKLEAEAQRLEREIENLHKQKTQLQFVLDAHQPTCCGDVPQIKMETGEVVDSSLSAYPQALRPSTLPISAQLAATPSSQAAFDFGLGSTGFTPIVSSSGVSVFLGTGSDLVSPTALLQSPTLMSLPWRCRTLGYTKELSQMETNLRSCINLVEKSDYVVCWYHWCTLDVVEVMFCTIFSSRYQNLSCNLSLREI